MTSSGGTSRTPIDTTAWFQITLIRQADIVEVLPRNGPQRISVVFDARRLVVDM